MLITCKKEKGRQYFKKLMIHCMFQIINFLQNYLNLLGYNFFKCVQFITN